MYDKDKLAEVPVIAVAERLGMGQKKRGKAMMTHCAWHDDQKPSMLVGGRYNRCHCFSCGADSDAVGLVMKVLGTDFKGACEWIEREGYEIREASPPNPLDYRRDSAALGKMRINSLSSRLHEPSHEARGNPFGGRKKVSKVQRLEALQAVASKVEKKPQSTEFRTIDAQSLEATMTMCNSFARCLTSVFGDNTARGVVRMYGLGSQEASGRHPDVLFPLINAKGQVLDVKVQAYDCDERSERFFHSLRNVCYWLGATLDREASFCHEALFGEHLLSQYPSKIVVLVESPKNACVGAAQFPEYLWLATGNKGMLKREVLEVLRGREVVVFPDNDAFDEWQQKLQTMQDIATFACMHTPGDTGEKGDIADWIIKAHPSPPEGRDVI